MLQCLPVELVLESLSYLTVQHLSALLAVSNSWKAFFSANESSIYRNAAALHAFVPSPDITLPYANLMYPPRSMIRVDDWKTFCKRRFQIDKAWIGRTPAAIQIHQKTGAAVHRFKVDEDGGFIIATSDSGGLVVTDIVKDEVVWSLPPHYVHGHAHCEYGNGFVCFDRVDGSIEVWRRSQDFVASALPTECGPDQEQLDASAEAAVRHRSVVGHNFSPWALLSMPDIHAFRFIFPTLLVASVNQAFLWDVTTAQLSLTITDTQRVFPQPIAYVELSDHLVFICFVGLLRVFSRHDGTAVYELDILDVCSNSFGHQLCLAQKQTGGEDMILVEQSTKGHTLDLQDTDIMFLAVHMSGSDLAILFTDSIIAVIRNFDKVIKGHIRLNDASLLISLLPSDASFPVPVPATYLAFENRKVAVTSRSGIYVIALDGLENMSPLLSEVDETTQLHPSFPNITIAAASRFESKSVLQSPSCLQVTDAALWFTWDPNGYGLGFVDREFDGVLVRRTAHRVATVVSISLMPDLNESGSSYSATYYDAPFQY